MNFRIVLIVLLLALSPAASGQDTQPSTTPSTTPAASPAPAKTPEPPRKVEEKKPSVQHPLASDGAAKGSNTTTAGAEAKTDSIDKDQGFLGWIIYKLKHLKDGFDLLIAFGALIVSALSLRLSNRTAKETAKMMIKQSEVMDCQTSAQLNALRLQARLTQLNQVKLRLETLLRGDSMNLRDNALPTANTQGASRALSDEQEAWVTHLVKEICGDGSTDEHKKIVNDLATQWILLEQSMQDAYDEVEQSLKRLTASDGKNWAPSM